MNLRDAASTGVDYDDLLTYNPLYHPADNFLGSADEFRDLQVAISNGDSESLIAGFATALIGPTQQMHLAETYFEENTSEIVHRLCARCHLPGSGDEAALASDHVMVPTSNPEHIALNTLMYKNIVTKRGVDNFLAFLIEDHHLRKQTLAYRSLEALAELLD